MSFQISRSAPPVEPVTLDDAKTQLQILESYADEEIGRFIKAARVFAESFTGRHFAQSACTATSGGFADCIELGSPLVSVEAVKYFDADNIEQTLSPDVYYVDTRALIGRIRLNPGQSWPTTYVRFDGVTIEFTCGESTVPEDVKQAMLMKVTEFDQDRTGADVADNSQAINALLHPYRIVRAI